MRNRFYPMDVSAFAGEIDVPTADVGIYELHAQSIADVDSVVASDQHALDARLHNAHERSVFVRASDDRVECLSDTVLQSDSGNALLHIALHFACRVLPLGAVGSDGGELIVGIRRRRAGENGFD